MSASIDGYLQEAANTLYALNADEDVRKRCRDRLEYYQDLTSVYFFIIFRYLSITCSIRRTASLTPPSDLIFSESVSAFFFFSS